MQVNENKWAQTAADIKSKQEPHDIIYKPVFLVNREHLYPHDTPEHQVLQWALLFQALQQQSP